MLRFAPKAFRLGSSACLKPECLSSHNRCPFFNTNSTQPISIVDWSMFNMLTCLVFGATHFDYAATNASWALHSQQGSAHIYHCNVAACDAAAWSHWLPVRTFDCTRFCEQTCSKQCSNWRIFWADFFCHPPLTTPFLEQLKTGWKRDIHEVDIQISQMVSNTEQTLQLQTVKAFHCNLCAAGSN